MRSEKALWKRLKPALSFASYQRHEDSLTSGIPDLSYAFRHVQRAWQGWIELKEAEPLRRKVCKVELSLEQYGWLVDRGMHGGDCWLLIQLDKYYWYYWSDLVGLDVNNLKLHEHKRESRFVIERLSVEGVRTILSSPI